MPPEPTPRGDTGAVTLRIRQATAGDAEGIARLYVASWNAGLGGLMPPRELSEEQVKRWAQELGASSRVWRLAEDEARQPLGFVGVGPCRDPDDSGLGEIDTIASAPIAWRSGVGRRLMHSALKDLADMGYRQGILWTVSNYHRGRAFYEATGWRESGEARDAGRQIAFRRSVGKHRCHDCLDPRNDDHPA